MTRWLVVDGYNVIHQTPPYSDLAEDDRDAARAALVDDVAAFSAGEWRAVVVFDGHGNPRSDGTPHEYSGVTVVFSPFGVDADAVIERYARNAREAGDEARVVTSDAQTQWAVMGGSVARCSSAEFAHEVRSTREEWRESNPCGERRSTIESRLDPQTRDVLSRWARGES